MAGVPDFARVRTALANSGFQNDYNATFQSINSLIDAVVRANDLVNAQLAEAATKTELGNYQQTKIVEVDVSGAPASLELTEYCATAGQLVIFKDYTGNASGNNISLVGDTEGTDPTVINTDFGFAKIYKSLADGLFHTW